MMKTLELDQITYCGDGSIGLKLRKIVTFEGETLSDTPHRVTVLPDQTVSEVMEMVNAAMAKEGWSALPTDDVAHADAVRDLVLTNASVAARRAKWIEEKPRMEAEPTVKAAR